MRDRTGLHPVPQEGVARVSVVFGLGKGPGELRLPGR